MRNKSVLTGPHLSRGTAIVTALLLLSIMVSISVVIAARLTAHLAITTSAFVSDRAFVQAQLGLMQGMKALNKAQALYAKNKTLVQKVQRLKDRRWATVTITDLQARYNINNLSDPSYGLAFDHLIQMNNPKISKTDAMKLTMLIIKYMNGDDDRKASGLLRNPSQLRAIKGFSSKDYLALSSALIALPAIVPLNIYTADTAAIYGLSPLMTKAVVKSYVDFRNSITDINEAALKSKLKALLGTAFNQDQVTVDSRYFRISVVVVESNERWRLRADVLTGNTNGKQSSTVLHYTWRRLV
jgi:type II secretory pathway component PulK